MSEQRNVEEERPQAVLTTHAMLVAWGAYAQELGLVDRLNEVELKQRSRVHRPQTKVLEFLQAILAAAPSARHQPLGPPADHKTKMVAEAWGSASLKARSRSGVSQNKG